MAKKTGQTVTFKGGYGGSGSQARAVIDGLEADVVSLAMAADVSKIQHAGLINPGWEKGDSSSSMPFYSTVAVFVRLGNPKKITGWKDLGNKDVKVVAANPKTSGGARWNFLALLGQSPGLAVRILRKVGDFGGWSEADKTFFGKGAL